MIITSEPVIFPEYTKEELDDFIEEYKREAWLDLLERKEREDQ